MSLSNERGSVVVLVAVMLFLIFFCVALVVDIGHIHNVKIELQRAVDAAALAGAQELPADESAVDAAAVAMGYANQVGNDAVVIDPAKVEVGWWKTEIVPGETAFDRFTAGGTTLNAVKVSVTLNVPHFFFFPVDDSVVTADAIAVAKPINPVMPLAIVSCIPIASTIGDPGALPGSSPCDIRYYSFSPDTDDTAAWTGLTFDKSADEIKDLLEGAEGRELYEQVVFGKGLANDGIENTDPTAGECFPHDLEINCGLGMIDGRQLAPAASFPAPDGFPKTPQPLPKNATTGIYEPGGFDPMSGYSENGALPRWYNLNDDGALKTDDHFVRLWTLDGLLLKGQSGITPETFTQYQARLRGYYDGTLTPPAPFNDGRLTGSNGLISNNLKSSEKKAIADRYGVDSKDVEFWPNASKVISQAGYPKVSVTNGTVTTLLDTFFANAEIATGEVLNCSENEPLSGKTLRLQVPVIFAGYCESWKALSGTSEKHTLNYVGLADFLVTRAWNNPDDFACADNFVSGSTCGSSLQTPAPLVSGEFRQVNTNSKAIEGLFKLPEIDVSTANSSTKIYLVE